MHFISTGNSVDKVPLEKLTGEAIILDVSEKTIGEGITNVDLDIYSKIVKPDDIVLLYTGTSDHWDGCRLARWPLWSLRILSTGGLRLLSIRPSTGYFL